MIAYVLVCGYLFALASATAMTKTGGAKSAASIRRSTTFIATHTNQILAKKCLPTFHGHAPRWKWIARHLAAHKRARGHCAPAVPWYVTKQIWAGNIIGRESAGDPWPNCPDPWDGSGSWQDTVNCENGGSWLDSPGYYRCGLQFAPSWEVRFGRLCP